MVFLLGLGFSIWSAGYIAANAIETYCGDRMEVWDWKFMGKFVTFLDTSYSEIEEIVLCSPECPCTNL